MSLPMGEKSRSMALLSSPTHALLAHILESVHSSSRSSLNLPYENTLLSTGDSKASALVPNLTIVLTQFYMGHLWQVIRTGWQANCLGVIRRNCRWRLLWWGIHPSCWLMSSRRELIPRWSVKCGTRWRERRRGKLLLSRLVSSSWNWLILWFWFCLIIDSMEEASALANGVGILAKQMLGMLSFFFCLIFFILFTITFSRWHSRVTFFPLSRIWSPFLLSYSGGGC